MSQNRESVHGYQSRTTFPFPLILNNVAEEPPGIFPAGVLQPQKQNFSPKSKTSAPKAKLQPQKQNFSPKSKTSAPKAKHMRKPRNLGSRHETWTRPAMTTQLPVTLLPPPSTAVFHYKISPTGLIFSL